MRIDTGLVLVSAIAGVLGGCGDDGVAATSDGDETSTSGGSDDSESGEATGDGGATSAGEDTGSSEGGGSTSGGVEPPEGWAESLGEAICAALFSCDCRNAAFISEQECAEFWTARLKLEQSNSGTASFDEGCHDELLAYLGDDPCAATGVPIGPCTADPALRCALFVGGEGDVGDDCEWSGGGPDGDCRGQLLCIDGKCVDECQSQKGDPCLAHFDPMGAFPMMCGGPESGLACDAVANECVDAPGLGEPCEGVCGADTYCDWGQEPPICEQQVGLGEPCEDPTWCTSRDCHFPQTGGTPTCVEGEPTMCSLVGFLVTPGRNPR